MSSVWTKSSGFSFGTFQEQHVINEALPVTPLAAADNSIDYTVISGALPNGLRVIKTPSGPYIKGSAFIVSNILNYQFCIRASRGNLLLGDRTYSIILDGATPPVFITPAGNLEIGVHQQLYALDSTYISYQILAADGNFSNNDLTYFIASGDGRLPPGVTMSSTGLISGYIIPSLSITPEDGSGTYDDAFFDATAYDFGLRPTNGYDTYEYAEVFYDYNIPNKIPSSLNSNYQFRVTATDGNNYSQRVFRIYVVGTDEFRADSTTLDGAAGGFTADSSYIRNPVWLTGSSLGVYRANNYITIPVALYDSSNVIFRLEATNVEIYAVTFQASQSDNIINSNHVTVDFVTVPPVVGIDHPPLYFTFNNYISGATEKLYRITAVEHLGDQQYRLTIDSPLEFILPNGKAFYIGTLSELPDGTSFDEATGTVYGNVPYQPAITKEFSFTLTATRTGDTSSTLISTSKKFTIILLGDITSRITWNSESNLGTIPANYISTLSLSASSNIPNTEIVYTFLHGNLPPGLSLSGDGEIIGIPNQFYDDLTGELGLTTFYETEDTTENTPRIFTNQTLDGNDTTIDHTYTFTVEASDQYRYSATPREFTITISDPNTKTYSNISTRPFLVPAQRKLWQSFINDPTIFTPDSVYRPNDSNFGVQTDLSMLVYAGIETNAAAAYVSAIALNTKRKRFKFGGIKKAEAHDANGNIIYEIVYAQMIDPMEPNGKRLPLSIRSISKEPETITVDGSTNVWQEGFEVHKDIDGNRTPTIDEQYKLDSLGINAPDAKRPDYIVTMDSTGYQASNPNTTVYFPSSVSNWQQRLQETVNINGDQLSSERNYLPLWMRTIQSGTREELGYTLAIPLCFCKAGTADTILLNIKYSGFDFKNLDYTVDRFTINAVTNESSQVVKGDKYLVFRNNRITV